MGEIKTQEVDSQPKVENPSENFDPDKRVDLSQSDSVDFSQPSIENSSNYNPDKRIENISDIDRQNKVINEVDTNHLQSELSTKEKGNYGEMKVDQNMRENGYDKISDRMVTELNAPLEKGIDGVYENPEGQPPIAIIDAKYGNAKLGETQDGRQMSASWIDNRLDDAVGKEKADEIRMEKLLNPDNVGSYVGHVDSDGKVTYDRLDNDAQVIEKDVKINA